MRFILDGFSEEANHLTPIGQFSSEPVSRTTMSSIGLETEEGSPLRVSWSPKNFQPSLLPGLADFGSHPQ
jgi:hypothetical protein